MGLAVVSLENFRNFADARIELPAEGVVLVRGANAQGKTNFLEAVSLLTALRSFRRSENSAMIRSGCDLARICGSITGRDPARRLDLELSLHTEGAWKVERNGKAMKKRSLLAVDVASVAFCPDDLELVKGSPSARRRFVDESLANLSQSGNRARLDFERALRQRSKLLKQAGGRLNKEQALTLDVWDERVSTSGEELAEARETVVSAMAVPVTETYESLSGERQNATFDYVRSWRGRLLDRLTEDREIDLRSGLTHSGPHRDDVAISLSGTPAREFGSQGEQRCLTLALRLAQHRLVVECPGGADQVCQPVLLLDDVFSELDPKRSAALASGLPTGQVFVSAATEVPATLAPAAVVEVKGGVLQ